MRLKEYFKQKKLLRVLTLKIPQGGREFIKLGLDNFPRGKEAGSTPRIEDIELELSQAEKELS